jgi:hypothetical protein
MALGRRLHGGDRSRLGWRPDLPGDRRVLCRYRSDDSTAIMAVPKDKTSQPTQRDCDLEMIMLRGRLASQVPTDHAGHSLIETTMGRYKVLIGPTGGGLVRGVLAKMRLRSSISPLTNMRPTPDRTSSAGSRFSQATDQGRHRRRVFNHILMSGSPEFLRRKVATAQLCEQRRTHLIDYEVDHRPPLLHLELATRGADSCPTDGVAVR